MSLLQREKVGVSVVPSPKLNTTLTGCRWGGREVRRLLTLYFFDYPGDGGLKVDVGKSPRWWYEELSTVTVLSRTPRTPR